MNEQEEAVARGALFLDDYEPEWFLRLDLGTLRLEKCSQCVLGQLYGSYEQAVEDIVYDAPDGLEADELGFDLYVEGSASLTNDEAAERYQELTDAWIAEVKKRIDEGINLDA